MQPDRPGRAITWVGHATVLVELDGVRLLTDPVLGTRVGALRRVAPPVTRDVTRRIDAMLVSHLHSDHADLPSLRRVGADVPILAAPPGATWLRSRGFADVRAVSAGDRLSIGDVTIEATPADHDGRRWPRGEPAEAVGFLVRGSRSIYFAGDTDLFAEMATLAGRVDVALLPVWGWGPVLGPGHLDPERAADAAALIRPRIAVPIHWGTLAPTWRRVARAAGLAPGRFAEAVARLAPDVEVRILAPGDQLALT